LEGIIIHTKTLPESLVRRIKCERVSVHEENGSIVLKTTQDGLIDSE